MHRVTGDPGMGPVAEQPGFWVIPDEATQGD